MPDVPGLTSSATIRRGGAARHGTAAGYRRLAVGGGEPHLVRDDLTGRGRADASGVRVVFRFVHVTDFQLADLTSPARLEFCQRLAGTPGWAQMLPSYRPQEFLSTHAIEALARTVRALTAESGADLVVTTGDNTDNAQRNELDAYLALMDGGGTVDPGTGAPDAIPSSASGGAYWNPEPSSRDVWKTERAYPDHPGLLAEATRPFTTTGFGTPWLACFGNHDCLVQGRAALTPEIQDLLTGTVKPVDLPQDPPADSGERPVIDAYRGDPMLLSRGPGRAITPRADRRIVSRAEYVRAHLDSAVGPPGHGFTEDNAAEGTAYYAHDPAPGVRFVVLDTTNPGGHADGSVGARQLAWLDERLREATDRMVVIVSHHGLSTMTNDAPPPEEDAARTDLPRHLADDVAAVLHRHGNVVLWISGHTHVNRVTPRPGDSGGFWEVSTSSVAEWPVQARLVELGVDPDGRPVIRTTCVDSAAPADPEKAEGLWRLATIHREAAANEPGSVGGPEAHGTPTDRNVILLR
jgi:metallophosphoesterase (TIGR03767 family)